VGSVAGSPLTRRYCPVPLTLIVCTVGVAAAVIVMALVRVPTPVGVKVTSNVHVAFEAREDEQGFDPPGAASKSPLPVIAMEIVLERLLVIVTVCALLVVSTVCAAKDNEAGEKESGRAAVPFKSNVCSATVALSVTTMAPLMLPLAPSAGENVTDIVQVAFAAKFKFAEQGLVPLPENVKSLLAASEARVTLLVLVFLTVTVLAALVVPTASVAKVNEAGVNVRGAVLPPEPVPERLTNCGLNELPSRRLSEPLIAPATVGVNVTAMLHFAAAASDPVQVVPVALMA
jgi:hypothetical protein